MKEQGGRVFYGWVIVAASAVLLAFGLGMFFSTNSVFVKPITDSLAFARGEFTLYRTIISIVSALFMPFYGRLIQRVGVKRVLLLSSIGICLTTFAYSFSTALWHFYIVAAFNGLFVNGISFMSVAVLINAWFDGKKGLASGLAFGGSGIGGAVMVPFITQVIERYGWQMAFRLMCVIGLIVFVPIVLIFIVDQPADKGLEPLADGNHEGLLKQKPTMNVSFSEALRMKEFWILLVAYALIPAYGSATNTHSAAYISDLGYSEVYVSLVISLFMIFLTFGKIILGLAYDRFGVTAGTLIISLTALAFPILALLAHYPLAAWSYAVCVGVASCAGSVPLAILIDRYFGRKDFPTIFSFYSMIGAFASSISVPSMGLIYDVRGSYRLAWWIFLFASIVIVICLIAVETVHRLSTE